MPRIIVLAECQADPDPRVVMEERVLVAHFESDHSSAQLLERLGWAIVDADELEQTSHDARSRLSPRR
jgi:hypothetical protein